MNHHLIVFLVCSLTGCAHLQKTTDLPKESLEQGVRLSTVLPEPQPDGSNPIPGTNYVFIQADSAAGLLVPIPFVDGIVEEQLHKHTAQTYSHKFDAVDPVKLTLQELELKPYFKARQGHYVLAPFVMLMESEDDRYRVSLVFQLNAEDWIGRYQYHLPTTYPKAEFQNVPAGEIASLRTELSQGVTLLLQLIERDNQGRLQPNGDKAKVGSLFIIGSKVAGLLSPTLISYPDTDIVEEGQDYVILRGDGDMSAAGGAGALMYGVHYFLKSQLHTFDKTP